MANGCEWWKVGGNGGSLVEVCGRKWWKIGKIGQKVWVCWAGAHGVCRAGCPAGSRRAGCPGYGGRMSMLLGAAARLWISKIGRRRRKNLGKIDGEIRGEDLGNEGEKLDPRCQHNKSMDLIQQNLIKTNKSQKIWYGYFLVGIFELGQNKQNQARNWGKEELQDVNQPCSDPR